MRAAQSSRPRGAPANPTACCRSRPCCPETGSLAFLGPPEFAGAQLAVNEINAAGGVLGQDVALDQGDSGDTTTDIANQTVDRQLAAGADVFVGAASSSVSSTFIDKLVEACKIQFSPANTSSLTSRRTRRRPVLPHRAVRRPAGPGPRERDRRRRHHEHRGMALQDPYGEGLLGYVTEDFAAAGGEVLDSVRRTTRTRRRSSPRSNEVVAADPEALVLIGFEESAQILTTLFEAGFTVESGKRIYFVDGNIGNTMGEQLPAGSLAGQKGTTPPAAGSEPGVPGSPRRDRSRPGWRLQLRPGDVRRDRDLGTGCDRRRHG